ncbi:hypothetical protein L107_00225 [Cyanobium sp. Copco_Reservoir_LC18]|jgi:hypothetical protein|uniref:hypothetical protein n=1 Tax=Cyanobium sp. Copco_Reservoir_LC18 TaxID=1328305 RepID=UPI001357CD3E|nr:hypothetical protein [Cyanobium sp. Copco_Reservoir_LC18]KAF0654898.1 hypothetical protein L107_00225 [Cyanobium sp. Copco_Reservoir_LC18]
MPWWLDLALLALAVALWQKAGNTPDDVWSVFQKFLSFVAVVVVLLGGRQLLLEILALALTFWLPSASRFDGGPLNSEVARSAEAPRGWRLRG